MKRSQRTILFLIADTGAGHRSAANALKNAINILSEEEHQRWLGSQEAATTPEPLAYRIEIVDVFEEYSRFPLREAVKLYGPAIRYNPSLYGQVFRMTNGVQSLAAVTSVTRPLIHKGLIRLITSVQPDVIVSIHPMLNHLTLTALADLDIKIPFLTVVTDLISVHHSWYAPGADSYIVPTEPARQLYLKRGLDPEKIHVLGMPIDPKFTLPLPNKEALRRRLGLDLYRPVILLTGGGDGAGGLRAAIHAISQAHLPVQLLVIAGRNKRLFIQLQREREHLKVPIKIFGFVNNMPEMMHAADVIITKAGPGTICEALSCDLPIILSGFVPGQEEGNVTFVTENNIGILAKEPQEVVAAVRRLTKPGSHLWQQQMENARVISRPRAAFAIVEHITNFMPPLDQPGIWQAHDPLSVQTRSTGVMRTGPSLRSLRPKFPTRVANISLATRRRNLRNLAFLRRATRTAGPLDLRTNVRRLPGLHGSVRTNKPRS